MERHRCKLCFKNFANGRALGGHMRSHMLNLYVPPKSEQPPNDQPLIGHDETDLDSVSSSSSEEELQELDEDDDDDENCLFGYGLRENPKKSIRLVDPQFSNSFHAPAHGLLILQDRESETESPKNPVRRRSKRVRKSAGNCDQQVEMTKPCKLVRQTELLASWVDPEPVSSISDMSPEEDVAYCLMMLSRDKWRRREKEVVVVVAHEDDDDDEQEKEEDYNYYEHESDHLDEEEEELVKVVRKPSRSRAKYKCDACNKVFKSYQALGGHRASHKKIRLNNNNAAAAGVGVGGSIIQDEEDMRENGGVVEEKIHECPVCFRVFASGQALGGHKRSHVIGSSATIVATTTIANYNTRLVHAKPVTKHSEMSLIDLNLPAPMEDEDDDQISQIELSAVSDGEFVKPH